VQSSAPPPLFSAARAAMSSFGQALRGHVTLGDIVCPLLLRTSSMSGWVNCEYCSAKNMFAFGQKRK
jgi:hypothetical protein